MNQFLRRTQLCLGCSETSFTSRRIAVTKLRPSIRYREIETSRCVEDPSLRNAITPTGCRLETPLITVEKVSSHSI